VLIGITPPALAQVVKAMQAARQIG